MGPVPEAGPGVEGPVAQVPGVEGPVAQVPDALCAVSEMKGSVQGVGLVPGE